MINNVIIKGVGYHLPEKKVTNDILLHRLNSTDEFIRTRTGVISRFHVNVNESLTDIVVPAMIKALIDANLETKDIDLLIVNTMSPDHHDPSQACLLQKTVKLNNIPAFDIRAQCSGFLYAAKIAIDGIQSKSYKNVMIVCGEILSKRCDYSDEGRNLSILLGDGAGVVILGEGNNTNVGFQDILLGADGDYFKLLWTEGPGSANSTFSEGLHNFRMNGSDMFKHAIKIFVQSAREILTRNQLRIEDIELVIPHQPNLRILEEVMKDLNIDKRKMFLNVMELGNIASASLPIAIAQAKEQCLLKKNKKYLFLTYGAGATWGASIYQN